MRAGQLVPFNWTFRVYVFISLQVGYPGPTHFSENVALPQPSCQSGMGLLKVEGTAEPRVCSDALKYFSLLAVAACALLHGHAALRLQVVFFFLRYSASFPGDDLVSTLLPIALKGISRCLPFH